MMYQQGQEQVASRLLRGVVRKHPTYAGRAFAECRHLSDDSLFVAGLQHLALLCGRGLCCDFRISSRCRPLGIGTTRCPLRASSNGCSCVGEGLR